MGLGLCKKRFRADVDLKGEAEAAVVVVAEVVVVVVVGAAAAAAGGAGRHRRIHMCSRNGDDYSKAEKHQQKPI